MSQENTTSFINSARRVLKIESEAISQLSNRLDAQFDRACQLLLDCTGRVIVTGIGKSGHIASKIAATLASTGTPAFFVHPSEAAHGDLGMITSQDTVICLSNSGESEELIVLLPSLKRLGVTFISMTSRPDSTLARESWVHLDTGVEQEACPLNLAPTASTTVALALGDALAVALLEARGFNSKDFARSHPGGKLGRQLLVRVSDIMHSGEDLPIVQEDVLLRDALLEMTRKGLGMTAVVDKNETLCGIFTDGDLRRALDKNIDFHHTCVGSVMTRRPASIDANLLASEAVQQMEAHSINGLLVTKNGKLVGAFNMHDLLRARVI